MLKQKPDYEFKSYVMNNYSDLFNLVKIYYKLYYHASRDESYYESFRAVSLEMQEVQAQIPEILSEVEKIMQADHQRLVRARKRIAYMLHDGKCYFLTLTFNDSVLQSTTAETRRKYVSRFLKSISTMYFSNVDFGAQNGREHYHAVIRTDLDIARYHWSDWAYGFASAKRIGSKETDFKKVSRYVCKLANHAIKATTQRNHAIYSRLPSGWESVEIDEESIVDEIVEEILSSSEKKKPVLDKGYFLGIGNIVCDDIVQLPSSYG